MNEAFENPTRTAIETVWRLEAPRLIGGLVRFVRAVDRAEDLAQDALLAALERWPTSGIPERPGAWLMTTAKHKAIDVGRRQAMMASKREVIAADTATSTPAGTSDDTSDGVGDDVLRLVLITCHPVLSREARVALTLRLVAGLSTSEIARAYLVGEATMAQRLVRAKRTLSAAQVPFEVPTGQALRERLPSVLEVLYAVFNEGYAASSGDDWIRPALPQEAMRMGRMVCALVPGDSEVLGLLALMELSAARFGARLSPTGEPVLLMDQDRRRWDRTLIQRGLSGLQQALGLARPLGALWAPGGHRGMPRSGDDGGADGLADHRRPL